VLPAIVLMAATTRIAIGRDARSLIANLDADFDKKASSILGRFLQSVHIGQSPKYIASGAAACGH